jgi:tetratricopeptide (TPR) repeat protein
MGDVATAGAVLRLMPKHVDLLGLLLATWDFDDRMMLRLFAEEFAGPLENRSLRESGDSVAYFFAKADHASFDEMPNLAEAYYDSARVVLESRSQRSSDTRTALNLASAYAALGRVDLAILAAEESGGRGVDAYLSRAETYTWVHQYDKAVEQIAQALEFASVEFSVELLRVDPLWAPLRDHPRYHELVGQGDVGR